MYSYTLYIGKSPYATQLQTKKRHIKLVKEEQDKGSNARCKSTKKKVKKCKTATCENNSFESEKEETKNCLNKGKVLELHKQKEERKKTVHRKSDNIVKNKTETSKNGLDTKVDQKKTVEIPKKPYSMLTSEDIRLQVLKSMDEKKANQNQKNNQKQKEIKEEREQINQLKNVKMQTNGRKVKQGNHKINKSNELKRARTPEWMEYVNLAGGYLQRLNKVKKTLGQIGWPGY